jgi:hypothetical protein
MVTARPDPPSMGSIGGDRRAWSELRPVRGGATLDSVGHGTLLAGRYRLEERVRAGADGSLWRAVDETLDRPVSVHVVRPGHRYTADVVDAARRAVLVEDARLIRVLDVGETGGGAFIVSEQLVGRTLAELLADGPLSAGAARRLVGEAAEALHRASGRGLHHLRLSAESLVMAPDGSVKVLGTAVEAALVGVDHHEDPVGADRADAVGLVRLLYAGLTGRGPGGDGPLGSAPPAISLLVPPSDLVDGVPGDLDTLCMSTLGPHDDGPQSPGELVQRLAPWEPAGAPAPTTATPATAQPPAAQPPAARALAGGAGALTARPSLLDVVRPSDGDDDWALLSGPTPAVDRSAPAEPEPLGPFIPPAPIARPPQDQTRFVLGLVAGLVVVGLILAVFSLRGLFGAQKPLVQPAPPIPRSVPTASTGSAAAAPSPPPSAPETMAVTSTSYPVTSGHGEVTGILAIDPQGDGDENGSTADRAIDGDASSTWRSARYSSSAFGGLKQGLGLYLQVSAGSVTSVTVDMSGTGGTVELRTAPGPGLDESAVVATAQAQGGRAVLTPTTPLTSGPLLLWFTQLPRQTNGEFRLVVSEITAS